MNRILGLIFLLGVLLSPVAAAAQSLGSSTTVPGVIVPTSSIYDYIPLPSSLRGVLDNTNAWFKEMLGVDLLEIIAKLLGVIVFLIKMVIDILLQILPRIRDLLSL